MFESLSEKVEFAFKSLKGDARLTELNIANVVKEIRRARVAADVNYKIAKEFTDKVKDKALGKENVLKAVKPGDVMVKIVMDEMVELMGGQAAGINIKGNPGVVLISGLQGSGKTTCTGKLAKFVKEKKSKKPLLGDCDVYRPAAVDQLTVLAEQIGVAIYKEPDSKNPVQIAQNAITYAKSHSYDLVIIDTAGRTSVDEEMMNEIENIKNAVQPTETLFVVDSMTGQDAVNTARTFNQVLDFTGVVLTKLDGDTRGGAALSIKSVVNKPIKFVSNGEKPEALDVFYPDRMAGRILGKGDVVTLVEKAQAAFDEEEAARLSKKIAKNSFDFDDFLIQLQQIKKMGNMKDLLGMIPGVGKAIKDMDFSDEMFKQTEAIIQSMTPLERREPEILNGSRRERIARGSGTKVQEVNQLLKQFGEMKQMMRKMNGGMPGGAMGQAMNRMRSPFGRS